MRRRWNVNVSITDASITDWLVFAAGILTAAAGLVYLFTANEQPHLGRIWLFVLAFAMPGLLFFKYHLRKGTIIYTASSPNSYPTTRTIDRKTQPAKFALILSMALATSAVVGGASVCLLLFGHQIK